MQSKICSTCKAFFHNGHPNILDIQVSPESSRVLPFCVLLLLSMAFPKLCMEFAQISLQFQLSACQIIRGIWSKACLSGPSSVVDAACIIHMVPPWQTTFWLCIQFSGLSFTRQVRDHWRSEETLLWIDNEPWLFTLSVSLALFLMWMIFGKGLSEDLIKE